MGNPERQDAEQSSEPAPTGNVPIDDVPDPEEDDLDDLDDMLDEFSAAKSNPAKLSRREPQPEPAKAPNEPEISDAAAEEFNKQLQEQMAALMGSMEESPEMKGQIEAVMKELGAAADSERDPEPQSQGKGVPPTGSQSSIDEEPFQETIRKTMERMQASGEQASAAAQAEDSDDILAQMLKDMQTGGLEGAGNEEGFNKMLMGMMEQLTNKEILYEPMKELHDKFPAWMAKNRTTTKPEDLQRYDEQQKLVGEIIEKFEQKSYSDSNAKDREYIVERMQQMQAAGSPPADLVGDMNAASDVLTDIDSGCAQQ